MVYCSVSCLFVCFVFYSIGTHAINILYTVVFSISTMHPYASTILSMSG